MGEEKKIRKTKPEKGGKKRGRIGRIIRRVLLVLLVVILAIVAFMFHSCSTQETHPGISQEGVQLPEGSGVIEAQDVLGDNAGAVYQSTHGFDWSQTEESFENQEGGNGAYTGTDVAEIQAQYCTKGCHSAEELDAYSATAEEAEREVRSMMENYKCDITEEQAQALIAAYSE